MGSAGVSSKFRATGRGRGSIRRHPMLPRSFHLLTKRDLHASSPVGDQRLGVRDPSSNAPPVMTIVSPSQSGIGR